MSRPTTEAGTSARPGPLRDFEGETPLQVMARQGAGEPTAMTSLERFPYYWAFPFAWYPVCFSGDLPPGAVKPARFLSRDLVLWRDHDGHAHVMDAYCPHLGANVAFGGRVEGTHLVCPFHWWEYDGDGANVRIPYSERTNRRARLGTYPTLDRNGFVLLWYHPDRRVAPLWDIPDKIHNPTPALADADGPIMAFRRWAAQFYVDGDPVAAARAHD